MLLCLEDYLTWLFYVLKHIYTILPRSAMSSRYQAVKVGGPFETIQLKHIEPKADEVLIRLNAIGLTHID